MFALANALTSDPVAAGPALRWYCLHTRPRKEQWIGARIHESLGLEVYAPRIREHREMAGTMRQVEGPLFPRYVFCRCELKDHYRAIKHAPDVIDLVSFGGRPAEVSDELIEGLRRWAGTVFDPFTSQSRLEEGDRVRITSGSMRGLDAIFMSEMNDKERVAVVLSILERDVHVTLSRWHIAPAA